jgi:hypothetical protein
MPGLLAAAFTTAEMVTLSLTALLTVIIAALAYRAWKLSRISPAERERQRRATLVAQGKMGDATVVEFRGEHLFYTYDVRGVEYTASQDMSALKTYLPVDLSVLASHVLVKYDPRNPANSIVLAEEWSGLRVNEPRR